MVRSFAAVVFVLGALLSGCATYEIPSRDLEPRVSDEPMPNTTLLRQVMLGDVKVSAPTSFAARVTPDAFREALEHALRARAVLADGTRAAPFVLEVDMNDVSPDRSVYGNRASKATVRYVLTDGAGRKFIHEVTSRFALPDLAPPVRRKEFGEQLLHTFLFGFPDTSAETSHAEADLKRKRLIVGGLVKVNIAEFIDSLEAFPDAYGASVAETR